MDIAVILIVVLFLGLILYQLSRAAEADRIRFLASKHGWEVLQLEPDRFGPGQQWQFGCRIYRLVRRDQKGKLHLTHIRVLRFGPTTVTADRPLPEDTPLPLPALEEPD